MSFERVDLSPEVTLCRGDCLDVMAGLPDASVDLTVTSQPYDNLRTYNGTLNDWTPEKWQAIIRELFRVTKQGGVVVWIVGDATINGSETGTSFRHALYAMECGFNLHDTMVWCKPNPMPGGSFDQYQAAHEFMFVWSKGRPKAANILREPCKHAGATGMRKRSSGVNGWKATGGVMIVRDTKRRPNFWLVSKSANGKGHPAVFPEALARDHILSWSNPGDVVLAHSSAAARRARWRSLRVAGSSASSANPSISTLPAAASRTRWRRGGVSHECSRHHRQRDAVPRRLLGNPANARSRQRRCRRH